MATTLFQRAKSNPTELVNFLMDCEKEIETGKKKEKVKGELQVEAAEQPSWLGYYAEKRDILKALKMHYEARAKKKRGELYKTYNENYQKTLRQSDIEQYINCHKDWVSLDDLCREITLTYDKMDTLVEALRMKGWAISYLVKLHTSGLEDTLI